MRFVVLGYGPAISTVRHLIWGVTDVYNFFLKTIDSQNLPIQLVGDRQLHVYFDGIAINQVLLELIKNAQVHSGLENPNVTIHYQLLEAGEDCTPKLEMKVRNCGASIEENVEGDIFEPFVSGRQDGDASGLGLYMVHNIVTVQLNGEISYQQKDDITFTVTIPVKKQE